MGGGEGGAQCGGRLGVLVTLDLQSLRSHVTASQAAGPGGTDTELNGAASHSGPGGVPAGVAAPRARGSSG